MEMFQIRQAKRIAQQRETKTAKILSSNDISKSSKIIMTTEEINVKNNIPNQQARRNKDCIN